MAIYRLEIATKPHLPDALALTVQARLERGFSLGDIAVRTRKVFHFSGDFTASDIERIKQAFTDPVTEHAAHGTDLDLLEPDLDRTTFVHVRYQPGVTDTLGQTALQAAEDTLGRKLHGHVYASTLYLLKGANEQQIADLAPALLYNKVIQSAHIENHPRSTILTIPQAGATTEPTILSVPVRELSDDALSELSARRELALTLTEMRSIQSHFRALHREPTDGELECIAQTWSEHCKHKIFASPIHYEDPDGHIQALDDGLFKTYIRGATFAVAAARKQQNLDGDSGDFLVSVFHDNAGVVRFTAEDHLVFKVETHNSPSALDPYGGAMTGVLGVNRDSAATGRGADLLTNTWGYCLGPQDLPKAPKGLMHPRRIREGVHAGVMDGGNHSGIPMSRGFELFDASYLGKPLVFCGTVAVMPVTSAGRPTHEKFAAPGDLVVTMGGRVGKDGLHGATFSSAALREQTPAQVVQIGDPITQKLMLDCLQEARELGLYTAITDNGAGGLSSSVGEMATLTGGARIDVSKVPLKYPGLVPWEILLSEAQERMTLAVPASSFAALQALAAHHGVELAAIGEFTDSGRFEVNYGPQSLVDLDLDFLHDGWPRPRLRACAKQPVDAPPPPYEQHARELTDSAPQSLLLALLGAPNLASNEELLRSYDHEVKGLSAIKPLVGLYRDIPATATVMRARHLRDEGVVLAEGIHPFLTGYGGRAMAHACVDEALRRVLCAGARLDRLAALDNFCWPDPIESPSNPDGAYKLALLVQTCQGLREACEVYGVPLISGKDSMKNDAIIGGIKVSIRPTLLVSMMGQLADVRDAKTLQPREPGERVYLLGTTSDERLGSELMTLLGEAELSKRAPRSSAPTTDLTTNIAAYRAFAHARDRGFIRAAHVTSRGGLAVALAHMAMSCDLGLELRLPETIQQEVALFSESTGRILFTCSPKDAAALEEIFADHALQHLGEVVSGPGYLRIHSGVHTPINLSTKDLRHAFHRPLS